MKRHTIKLWSFAALTFLLLTATSCKKNGENIDSDLRVAFQLEHEGANYSLENVFRVNETTDLIVDKFQFYISDFAMTNSDGDVRNIEEIALFSFDANGKASLDFEMPRGQYESIDFGIGVKKALNEADPANYSEEGHPLNTTENTYWGWATMYRFITIEGRYDSDLDGTFEGTFAYHTGHEESYRNFSLAHDIDIDKKDQNNLTFIIDIKHILGNPENSINISEEPYYHGGMENFHLSEKISDNFHAAISLKE